MRRFLFRIILLMILFFSPGWKAMAALVALPQDGSTPLSTQELRVTPQGIQIQVRECTLRDLLQRIQNESGICFSLSSGLMEVPITIALDEPNWTAVVRRLLRGFNKIEVWNESDDIHHVILVESGSSGQDVSLNKEGFMLADRTRKSEKTGPVYKGLDKGETSPEVSSPRAGSPPPTESQGMGGGSPPPDDYVYPENAGPDVSGAIEDGSPPPDDYKYPENAGPPGSGSGVDDSSHPHETEPDVSRGGGGPSSP